MDSALAPRHSHVRSLCRWHLSTGATKVALRCLAAIYCSKEDLLLLMFPISEMQRNKHIPFLCHGDMQEM